MKFHETNFEEYLIPYNKVNLHPKLDKLYKSLPKNIEKFKNIIFYGPAGVGKYTQMLAVIHRYSPSQLKYEKKLSVTYNKNTYFFKISDIHYEIDLAILGCHSKLLWNDVYNQIVDIILVKKEKIGIIVCKNFQEIHIELLETFYSYMQTMPSDTIRLKFILITEATSFIPDNIINCCTIINVPRPSRIQYNKCFDNMVNAKIVLSEITNMKHLHSFIVKPIQPYEVICSSIYSSLVKLDTFNFNILREQLYDILIYNLNVDMCIWSLLERLINEHKITTADLPKVLMNLYDFFKHYNNNYRPIYHLERMAINLIQVVNTV
uniref:Replication factor C C-terminal domain-containing protein n=1 Tax=viral metagenome TaxID=1070528 RepID=A0A6C0IHJ7_9ZZZZ